MKPIRCDNCDTIMGKVEDIQGVELFYKYNVKSEEYDIETDQNWYGEVEIRYVCPECGKEIEE